MQAVKDGRQPQRPPQEECAVRGLNDGMWNLFSRCWQQIPSQRPNVKNVTEELLSGRGTDSRSPSICVWDEALMSRLRSTLCGNSFA
jgi:hypothetical protein